MEAEEPAFVIAIDNEDQVLELEKALTAIGAEVQSSRRRQLDGADSGWITIVTTTVVTAPALILALKEFLTRNHPKSLTYDGLTIENPRPKDVDALVAHKTSEHDG